MTTPKDLGTKKKYVSELSITKGRDNHYETYIDIDLDDILDNLNLTVMGIVGANKAKWSFATDLIYLDIEADNSATVPLPSHPVQVSNVSTNKNFFLCVFALKKQFLCETIIFRM